MTGYEVVTVALLGCIVLASFVVRGMSGFGTSLIALPLMAHVVPVHTAIVLLSLLALGVLLLVGVRDRAHVVWVELQWLIVPTALGVVVGVYVFGRLHADVMAKLLGVFIIAYAITMLVGELRDGERKRWPIAFAIPFGFATSFVDSIFGGGGGVLTVIYMHRRGYDKVQFRSTLSFLWIGESIMRIGAYAIGGHYDLPILLLAAVLMPVMVLGTWIGERLTARMSPAAFTRLLGVMLVGSGASLLVK